MDSSLSIVPPVVPRPRPESLATGAPQAATMGSEVRLTLSPTPPVECLSTQLGERVGLAGLRHGARQRERLLVGHARG